MTSRFICSPPAQIALTWRRTDLGLIDTSSTRWSWNEEWQSHQFVRVTGSASIGKRLISSPCETAITKRCFLATRSDKLWSNSIGRTDFWSQVAAVWRLFTLFEARGINFAIMV